MLKVIQVKVQEQVSRRKKNSETAWFDRLKNRLNRSRIISAEFELSLNNSLNPLRIKVLDLILLVYKRNPKHVFKRLFRERRVCLFCRSRVLYPKAL